jgi:hypothetical protein
VTLQQGKVRLGSVGARDIAVGCAVAGEISHDAVAGVVWRECGGKTAGQRLGFCKSASAK